MLVGLSQRRYTAHKDILNNVDFFVTYFSGRSQEDLTGEIELPEDDPYAFGEMLQFLYYGSIKLRVPNNRFSIGLAKEEKMKVLDEKVEKVVSVYTLARKYAVESLENLAVDCMVMLVKCHFTVPIRPLMAYESHKLSDHNSKIAIFLQRQVAYSLRTSGREGCRNDDTKSESALIAWSQRGGRFVRRVFWYLTEKKVRANPCDEPICHWHRHTVQPVVLCSQRCLFET